MVGCDWWIGVVWYRCLVCFVRGVQFCVVVVVVLGVWCGCVGFVCCLVVG